jgi:hypothetical protein
MHSDCPDAVPAMQVMVLVSKYAQIESRGENYYATGLAVATDSVTFNGVPFTVLPPDAARKALGVFMTLTGSYKEHTEYMMAKMRKRCKALAEDDAIPRGAIKELAITTGMVPILQAIAGVVPWTGAELDVITKLWIRAFKQSWEYSTRIDSSAIIIDRADGKRCPWGREIWTEDVLTVMDQCIELPGEISDVLLDRLRIANSPEGAQLSARCRKWYVSTVLQSL